MPDDGWDDELLGELRDAWRAERPSPPSDAFESADPQTRAAVEWARTAWTQLEVPPARVPTRLQARASRARRPRRFLWRTVAATAAVFLAVLALAIELPLQRTEEQARTESVQTEETAPAAATSLEPARREPVRIAAVTADNLELRSGPVRLILIKPPQ